MTTKPVDPTPHPVDRYLTREPDNKAAAKLHRDQILDALEHFALALAQNKSTPPTLALSTEFSAGFLVYLFAHRRGNNLLQEIPTHLKSLATKARKNVDSNGEFSLDHALGIVEPPFQGAKPKEPGEHKHKRLFIAGVITGYNMTIARENDSSIPGDILGDEMPLNDAYRWIASFCRDATYPMMLSYATYQFIKSRSK